MKKSVLQIVIIISEVLLVTQNTSAHPGSGIVLDRYGNIYFINTHFGVVKISPDSKLTYINKATDGHWLCLDENGIFSQSQPKYFERITLGKQRQVLIYAGGGSPIVVNRDGNFYYCGTDNNDKHPGAKTLVRETPGHLQTIFASGLKNTLDSLGDGITGLAAGPDTSLYLACWNSLLKVSAKGKVSVLLHPVVIKDCDEDPADHKEVNRGIPLLRGVDIDSSGVIYVAATSCHCVLKITPQGEIKTILKAERPWSPTGVTVGNGNIYVLEYTNANGPSSEGWSPRVRKISKDGTVTVIADLSSPKSPQP
jgi:hypothetical protein